MGKYKLDPITGQMVKNDSELAVPTNKQWNAADYIGTTTPGVGKLDQMIPMPNRQPASQESPPMFAGLRDMMTQKAPASMTREGEVRQLKGMDRPPIREDEYISDDEMKSLKPDSIAYENRILAQGLEFNDEQDAQLAGLTGELDNLDKLPNRGGSDYNTLNDKYEALHDEFRQKNKRDYWGD